MSSSIATLWVAIAWALPSGTPVVYDGGDGADHVATVVARSGLPADQLEAVPVSEVFQRPPVTLGDAVVRRCAGKEVTFAEARGDFVRAEAALSVDDDMGAADQLDLAVAKLGCLSEVVDAPAAAKVFLLRGALAAAEGRLDDARGELRTALSLHPKATWTPGYPTEGSHVLAEVIREEERFTLGVTPEALSGPWIDGHDVGATVRLRPGLHLAQHSARTGLSTAWLVVGGDATWALPDALPTSALDHFIAGPEGTPAPHATAHVLAGAFPDAAAVYVSHRGGLWLVQRQGAAATVTELSPPEVAEEAAPSKGSDDNNKKKKRKKKKGK